MRSFIGTWLRPPAVLKDDNEIRIAQTLNAILLISLGGAIVYILFILALARSEAISLLFSTLPILFILGLRYLLNKISVYVVSMLFVACAWLNLTLAAAADGYGIRGTSLYGYILIVVVAGLLISWRASVAFALLNIFTGLLLIYATDTEILPNRVVLQTDFTIWSANAVFSVSAAFVLAIALKSLENASRRAALSESYYRMLFEAAPNGICIVDSDNRITMANEALYQMTGFSPADVIGRSALDFVDPQDLVRRPPRSFDQFMVNGPLKRERVLVRKDGLRLDVIISSSYMPDGHLQYILQDITERKRIEEALRVSEEKFSKSFQASPDAVTLSSLKSGKFIDVNEGFIKMSGYSREEALGRSAEELKIWGDIHQRQRMVELLQTKGRVRDFETTLVRKTGEAISCLLAVETVEIGGETCMVVVTRDLSRQKRIERERESLIRDLEAKNAELEQFTYTVSHDLKAPLITIKGFLGLLSNDALSGNRKRLEEDIQRIGEAADKMHILLNNLLELSRIGRMMNIPEPVAFADLVLEARAILQGRFQQSKVELRVEEHLPVVQGDRQRLLEVVQNLIDNAAKFMGDQSHPLIEIGQVSRPDSSERMATFFVRDNGIGIAPEFHERIFGLFNRLDPRIEGTGVGLALVRRVVEYYGGKIWVESEVGQGSTFFFTLPLAPVDKSPAAG